MKKTACEGEQPCAALKRLDTPTRYVDESNDNDSVDIIITVCSAVGCDWLCYVCYFMLQSNKPLLEKKRRARINRSLDQLKTLLIDAIKNDVSACLYLLSSF